MLEPASQRRLVTMGIGLLAWLLGWLSGGPALADEPPALNPFAPVQRRQEDVYPGYVETSDGKIYVGNVYLTRDARLQIYDEALQRQREVPLRVVKRIECRVVREWMEREWRFKELALNEKVYTGRTYPARLYEHTITFNDDRTITGAMSAIVYVKPIAEESASPPGVFRREAEPERLLLHKRDKGEIGDDLKSLVYAKLVKLGEEALEEGREKAARQGSGGSVGSDG